MTEEEQQIQAIQQAAMTAQQNELHLHRRLSPYLEAEIANRDEEIERLEARIAELEGELEAEAKAEPEEGEDGG